MVVLVLVLVFAFAVAGCWVTLEPGNPEPGEYEPVKWFDFFSDNEERPAADLTLPEFPGITFRYVGGIIAIDENGVETLLIIGMPVWNVYIADLNGDGFPELCATAFFGSGLIDERIIVYDYANEKGYELSDRGAFDYALSMEDGRLVVTQKEYAPGNPVRATGTLAIIDSELVAVGIDRPDRLE